MIISSLQNSAHSWCQQYRKKRERTPEYLFAHAAEELGEAVKAWRNKQLRRTMGTKAGVDHPEGLGSELADVVILMSIIAEECDIDLDLEIELKMRSLWGRLEAKKAKKGGTGRSEQ